MKPMGGQMKDSLNKGVAEGHSLTDRGPGHGGRNLAQPETGHVVGVFEWVPIWQDGWKRDTEFREWESDGERFQEKCLMKLLKSQLAE